MKGEELKELLLHLPVELYEEVKEAIGEYGVSITQNRNQKIYKVRKPA